MDNPQNEATLTLEVPVLLPQVEDERDQCITRLQEQVLAHRGITRAHVDHQNGQTVVCLHYDPNLISGTRVRRLAQEAGAQVSQRFRHETLRVFGMDCGDCATSIEHVLSRVDGVIHVSVNYAAERMRVEYDTRKISRRKIRQRIGWMGYRLEEEEPSWLARHRELLLALIAGLFLSLGYLAEQVLGLPTSVTLALYLIAYLAGGYEATRHGLAAALHLRFDIDFLMVVAAIGAATLGHWAEGGFLLFLFSLGHALEHYAMGRARRAIEALGQLAPRTARVRRDGQEVEVPVEDLQRGDLVIVRPGERIPVDGEVTNGASSVDQSAVTGESVPVLKEPGSPVFAGTVNGEAALEVRVTRLAEESTLARVIRLVEEAQTQKSPTQQFTERFSRVFVPSVLASALGIALAPPLLGWLTWSEAILRSLTVLVAASPCALAIATPASVLSGVAQAARNGVLVKGGVHLENLGVVTAMAFDKTGTLTLGRPQVTDVVPAPGVEESALLRYVAAAESRSRHPLARAVLEFAQTREVEAPVADRVEAVAGRGLVAEVAGETVTVGTMEWLARQGGPAPEPLARRVTELEAEGKTTIVVRLEDRYLGALALADQPRPEAAAMLARLRALGVQALVMLTGDNERVAATIARQVGLTAYDAGLLPEDKVAAVQRLKARYGNVAMVGDGVNDAPALAAATVGIAMGAGGSDAALETADVALMGDDLSRLPFAVGLSRAARAVIRQNLLVSLGVIALLLPAAVLGVASIGPAITLHEGSTLIVVFNALRLLRYREAERQSAADDGRKTTENRGSKTEEQKPEI